MTTTLPQQPAPDAPVVTQRPTLEDVLLQHEISQFFFHEARLLAESRWEQWLDLLAPDLHYYMPLRENLHPRLPDTTEDELHLALFDEDKEFVVQRVMKFGTGVSWSEDPRSRTTYIVGNVQVDEVDEAAGEYAVTSAFLLHRNRLEDETDTFTGLRHDRLRRTDGGLQVCRRRVLLDQSVVLAKNLSVFF